MGSGVPWVGARSEAEAVGELEATMVAAMEAQAGVASQEASWVTVGSPEAVWEATAATVDGTL